jgi:hypothetical protein
LVSVLAASLFAFVVIEMGPELSSVVQDQARDRIQPGLTLGESATVQGNPLRPELRLSVDGLRSTRVVGAKAGERAAVHLMAARVTIRNEGSEAWTSGRGTTFALVDRNYLSHTRRTHTGKVTAGRMLPALIKVKPGQTKRGIMVFGLPRGVPAEAVQIRLGPGYPKTLRWSVG